MPIKISNELPAYKTLTEENIFVMTETRAMTQDIRPLRIAIVNLMPTKIDTETQLLRLLGNTSLQVETELVKMRSHVSKNTSVKEMVALLDKECEYLWNPIKAWEKIENSLRKSQIPNKYIAFFEDRFFRSVIDNESNINDASFDQLNSFENFKYCVTIVASLIDVILRFQGR